MSDSEEYGEYAYSEDDEEERWYNTQGAALAVRIYQNVKLVAELGLSLFSERQR